MLRYLKLIGLFAQINIQNTTAYRFDFATRMLMSVLQMGAELAGLWVIFSNTQSLAGWNVYEIVVLLGVFRMMTGIIALVIAPSMRALMADVRTGKLDYVLLMPVAGQFYLSLRRIVFWRVNDIFLGMVLITVASVKLEVPFAVGRVATFGFMLACGVVTVYSVWLSLATLAFWFTRVSNIEMVFWNLFEAGRYPVSIYRPNVRWALTYVIPLALLTTFPAAELAGKAQPGGTVSAAIVATMAFILSSLFFRFGLRRYTGASA